MAYEELIASNPYIKPISDYLGVSIELAIILFAVVLVWSLVWKALALWKSAKNDHKVWFIVLLIINTIGILEILYIYVFANITQNLKDNLKNQKVPKPPKARKEKAKAPEKKHRKR
jgi:hypothetical protein